MKKTIFIAGIASMLLALTAYAQPTSNPIPEIHVSPFQSIDMTKVRIGLITSKRSGERGIRMLIPRSYVAIKPVPDKVWAFKLVVFAEPEKLQPYFYAQSVGEVTKGDMIAIFLNEEKNTVPARIRFYTEGNAPDSNSNSGLIRYEIKTDGKKADVLVPVQLDEESPLYYECTIGIKSGCHGYTSISRPELEADKVLRIEYVFARSHLMEWRSLDKKIKDLVRSFIVEDWPEGTPALVEE